MFFILDTLKHEYSCWKFLSQHVKRKRQCLPSDQSQLSRERQANAGMGTAMELSSALFSGYRTHDNYEQYALSAECSSGIKNQQADIWVFCVEFPL